MHRAAECPRQDSRPPSFSLAALPWPPACRARPSGSRPSGDDANPGTEEQPLRTIARARDVVRTLNHDMADDITVFIAGEHHLDEPLEFRPEDSGTNGFQHRLHGGARGAPRRERRDPRGWLDARRHREEPLVGAGARGLADTS